MLKKLIVLALVLACPTAAWGATKYAVTCGGASSILGHFPLPDKLNLDITLTLDEAGACGFGGALIGPAGLTIVSRTFHPPVSNWGPPIIPYASYDGQPISARKDFGIISLGVNTLPIGETKLMTLQLSGLAGLAPGRYEFLVGHSSDLEFGAWWTNTGEPTQVDSIVPFVIDIPEPATMLLLAAALPFLRRREA
jgi:hypothetical protein